MKTYILILLFASATCEDVKENVSTETTAPTTVSTPKSTSEEGKIEPTDIGVRYVSSSGHPKKRHPLPPAAVPGILNEHETIKRKPKGERMLLSELRHLKSQYLPLEQSLNRIRRSFSHPNPLNQRDLRRLRRDLGYDTTPDFSSHQRSFPPQMNPNSPHINPNSPHINPYPAHMNPYIPHMNQASIYGQRAHRPTAIRGKELDRLLQGLDFLEQLAFLTQEKERELVPLTASAAQQRKLLHGPASRFAPQPKLFMDERLADRPMRVKNLQEKDEVVNDDLLWIPEKRWPKPRASLSMIPGFKKRSVFREAAQQQLMNQRTKRQKKLSSIASFLGAEVDPSVNRIRRTAM